MGSNSRMEIFYSCFLILSILTVIVLSSMYITLLRYENKKTHRTTVTVRPTPIAVKTKADRQIHKLQRIQRKGLNSPSCPHVLIFTHPRSGSTLTGHIIQHVHESFYAFEPLRYLSESLEKGERIVFLNRTERSYHESDIIWMKAEILYRWFTCDFDRINLRDLSSLFIGAYSTNLNEYAACVRRIPIPTKTVPECISLLKEQCNRAGVRIIKTIRLNIESVELLLELMPNLKVIYLTRDPRGKLASQMALKPAEWEIVTFFAKDLCELLIKETDFILKLREKYPQRLKILIYERFANDPVEFSRRLFAFINLKFTTEIKLAVKSLTMTNVDSSGCYWCAKRTNSDITANRWRQRVLFKHIKQVDKICSNAYQQLGYRTLPDEAILRNMSCPLFVDTNIMDSFL